MPITNQISFDYQKSKKSIVCVIRVICVLIFILTHLQLKNNLSIYLVVFLIISISLAEYGV
jgi:hypothetical protein